MTTEPEALVDAFLADDRVLALKALWRDHPLLSSCAPLAGKLEAILAAKDGAWPEAACYVSQGYELPEGLEWGAVAWGRRVRGIEPHMVPVAAVRGGPTAWGTPMLNGEYLLHPGNI